MFYIKLTWQVESIGISIHDFSQQSQWDLEPAGLIRSIKPALVVAMGATAAQSLFGKITPTNKNRGRMIELDDGIKVLVTVRPSYRLRLPDADAKAREYRRLVDDLKIAATLLRKSANAA